MRAPGRLRPLVAESWQRSARVDPDAAPVLALGDDELDAARQDGPLATLLPVVRRLLLDDSRSAGCVVAVGDAAGRLVWVDGARSTRRAAEDMGFVPGADWSEERVGTSAPGTALRLDRPVQIRSDEHYANAVKPFSCTAVPVHDASGATVGVLDLTGDDRAVEAAHAVAARRHGRRRRGPARPGRGPTARADTPRAVGRAHRARDRHRRAPDRRPASPALRPALRTARRARGAPRRSRGSRPRRRRLRRPGRGRHPARRGGAGSAGSSRSTRRA
ncbi:GAF domain-containing protein [Curtobacterium flaccumfaciens]|nr:GAF domain-containing protein [Curtobacterium flaccumfaciens]